MENISNSNDDMQQIQAFNIKHDRNYPVMCDGDSIILDTKIKSYKGEGWYLYMDDVFRVALSPKHLGEGVCLYQHNGETIELLFEDFHPLGKVKTIQRNL